MSGMKIVIRKSKFQKCSSYFSELYKHWCGVLEKCTGFIDKFSGDLHPLNIVMTRIRIKLMAGQIELKKWKDAVDTGNILSKAYR